MDTHRAALARLADERAQAIRDALAGGMSQAEVAKALGITRQAVNQALMRPSPVLR
jgi:DNA-directed RNA polymerase specialized sigma24 family protein